VAEVPKSREGRRGEKPQGGLPVSRESGGVRYEKDPGAPAVRSARERVEKAREGMGVGQSLHNRRAGQETLEGEKPREASDGVVWPNPRPPGGILGGVPYPEGESQRFGAGMKPRRVAALERAYGTVGGTKASKGQPHERDRDETSPAGRGGSKASGG